MLAQEDLDLLPSDVVAFNRGVSLDGDFVVDHLTGTKLPVNSSAALLLAALDGKTSLEHCALFVAAENGWESDEVLNDFAAVIDALERSSLVHVRRSLSSRIKRENAITAVGRIVSLDWPRPTVRRYAPNLWSLAIACLRATRWGLLAAFIVSTILAIVFLAQGLGHNGDSWKLGYAYIPFLLFLGLVGHIIFHEAGHLAAMNVLAPRSSKYVLVRGLQVSVAHASLEARIQRTIAIAGPLAGLIGAQLLGIVFLFIPPLAAVAPVVNLSGLLHLYSFFPWAADGRMIWRKTA